MTEESPDPKSASLGATPEYPEATATAAPPPPADPADPVTVKLQEAGISDTAITQIKSELGVTTVDDLSVLTVDDLTSIGIKPVPARKLISGLAPAAPAVETAAFTATSFEGILPMVPDDGTWLDALRAGGVLKIQRSSVVAAVRAALADRVNLYDVPDRLVQAMLQFAKDNEEPVDEEFYALRKLLTRRSYAEIFAAIDDVDGRIVTETNKKELFQAIDIHMWPAIIAFYNQLKSWQEAWVQGAANPMALMAPLLAGSGAGFALPPGLLSPPDTGVLRDQGEELNNAINKAFAGVGVPVAAALAYDASQIKKSLENTRLPSMIGAANRDQMLRQLGVAVSAVYPRLERNLITFVLGAIEAKDQPGGTDELRYFGALYMLGSQIQWDELSGGKRSKLEEYSGIGGGRRPGGRL
jgi:hypothetical protein